MSSKVILLIFCLTALHVCCCFPLSGGSLDFPDPLNSIPSHLLFLISGASFILLIYVMIGCVCCPNKSIKALTYQNGMPINRLNENNSSFENQTEFAIFPPHSAVIDVQPLGLPGFEDKITFEPLPDILPRKVSNLETASRPAHFQSFLKNTVSLHDWFDDPNCNFPRDQLQYINELGVGWFGRVVEGEATHIVNEEDKTKAIVKILREEASPTEHLNFLYEALPYRDLYHPNLVRLLGRCLESDPFLLIMEHNLGDLKSFLLGYDQKEYLIKNGILLRIAYNVASGLRYLHKCGFTHVDLAAHNCFIFDDMTAKIGDYGISLSLHRDDYYCVGDIALPIRWLSPETLVCTEKIIETKPISKEANVWAFGIVAWEIFQFGNLPYEELSNEEVIQKVLVEKSVQLQPISLHYSLKDELFLIMKECWKDINCRPTMQKVEKFLCQLYNDRHNQKMLESFEERWNSLQPKSSDSNHSAVSYRHDLNYSSEGDTFSSFENSFDLLNHNINCRLSPGLNVLNGSTDELTENDACLNSVSLGGEQLSDKEDDSEMPQCHATDPADLFIVDTETSLNQLADHEMTSFEKSSTNSYNINAGQDNNFTYINASLNGTEDEMKDENKRDFIIDAPQAFSDFKNETININKLTIPFIIVHEAPSNETTNDTQIKDIQVTNGISLRKFHFVFKEHKNLNEANSNTLNNPDFSALKNDSAFDEQPSNKSLVYLKSSNDDNSEFLSGKCEIVSNNSLYQNERGMNEERQSTCVTPSFNNPDFRSTLCDHTSSIIHEPLTSTPLKCTNCDSFNITESNTKFVSDDCENVFYDNSFNHGRILKEAKEDLKHPNFIVLKNDTSQPSERSNDLFKHSKYDFSSISELFHVDSENGISSLQDSWELNEADSIKDNETSKFCLEISGDTSVESLSCTSHSIDEGEDFKTAQSTFDISNKSPINSLNEGKVITMDENCALPMLVTEYPSHLSSNNSVDNEIEKSVINEYIEATTSDSFNACRNSYDFEKIKMNSEDILNYEHDTSLNTSYSVDDIKFSSSDSTPFSMSENLSNTKAEINMPLTKNLFDQYISSKQQEMEENSVDLSNHFKDQECRMQSAGNLRNPKQNSSFLNYYALSKHDDVEKDDESVGHTFSSKSKLCLKAYGEVVVEDLETGEQTIITETCSSCDDFENSAESDEILKINIETDEAIIVDSSEALVGFVPSRSIELLQECEIMPVLDLPFSENDWKNEQFSHPAFENFSSIYESHENQPFRNFCLQNEVIEEEITEEITTPSSVHSTASFSSNDIFTEGEEKMSQGSESYHQMEEASDLPVMEHFYSESDDGSKTDISNSCSDEPLETRHYLTDIENNMLPDHDVMHSWQPLQSIRWNSDETIDLEENICNPVIIESQEILAGSIGMTVKGLTSALSQMEKDDHLNIKMLGELSLSPYSSVESSPCRDSVYTPDFESESDETGGRSTSCSSTSGSFECIHNKFLNISADETSCSKTKVFSKTWDCTATPTKGVLVSPEKKFSSLRKSVSFHEEDPQIVFEYPPASYSSEEEEKSVYGVLGWDIDFNKYADWELGDNEEEFNQVIEIEELDSEPYVRRPTSSNKPTIYSLTSELSDDDDDDIDSSRVPSNSPEEARHPLSDLEMSRLVCNQLNKLVFVERRDEELVPEHVVLESVPNAILIHDEISSVDVSVELPKHFNHKLAENSSSNNIDENILEAETERVNKINKWFNSSKAVDDRKFINHTTEKYDAFLTEKKVADSGSNLASNCNAVSTESGKTGFSHKDIISKSSDCNEAAPCGATDHKEEFKYNSVLNSGMFSSQRHYDSKFCNNSVLFEMNSVLQNDAICKRDIQELIEDIVAQISDSVPCSVQKSEKNESALNPFALFVPEIMITPPADDLLRQLLHGDSEEAFNFEFNSGDFFDEIPDLNLIKNVEHSTFESSPLCCTSKDTTHL